MEWKEFEEQIKKLLALDKAEIPAGSGSGKKEEDVIGVGTISQCKCTGNTNISILKKDMDRLLEASKLREKFPLFFTNGDDKVYLTMPLNDDTEAVVKNMLRFGIAHSIYTKLMKELLACKTIKELQVVKSQYGTLVNHTNNLRRALNIFQGSLADTIQIKETSLLQYDLFEDSNELQESKN